MCLLFYSRVAFCSLVSVYVELNLKCSSQSVLPIQVLSRLENVSRVDTQDMPQDSRSDPKESTLT